MAIKNKYIKWITYILLLLLILTVLSYLLIQLPVVQNFAKKKILTALSEKYEAKWSIGDLRVKFFDSVEADDLLFLDQNNDTLFSADMLLLDIGIFSLFDKQVTLDEIVLENARLKIYEDSEGIMNYQFLIPESDTLPSQEVTRDSTSSWSFDLNKIILLQSEIDYITSSQKLYVKQYKLQLDINKLDIDKKEISTDELLIDKLTVDYASSSQDSGASEFKLPYMDWAIMSNRINLSDAELVIRNSPNDITAKNINLQLDDLKYYENTASISIKQLQAKLNNQIELQSTKANVKIDYDIIYSTGLNIKTNKDKVTLEEGIFDLNKNSYVTKKPLIQVHHSTLQNFSKYIPKTINLEKSANLKLSANALSYNPNLLSANGLDLSYGDAITVQGNANITAANGQFDNPQYLKADLNSLYVDLQSADRILNSITIPDSLSQYKNLTAEGQIEGNKEKLIVNNFTLVIDDVFSANASGTINNVNNSDQLSYDLKLSNVRTNISQLPIPPNEKLALDSLGILKFDGIIIGDRNTIKLDGKMQSDLGGLAADIELGIAEGLDSIAYDGTLTLEQFSLGTFLRNTNLDKITITTDIEGKGIDAENLNSNIRGDITDFSFQGYKYDKISINAVIKDKSIDGAISLDDKNLKLDYSGVIDISEDYTVLDFVTTIDSLNLMPLGLIEKDISVSGTVTSKFYLPLKPGQDGSIEISKLRLSNPNDSYSEDSIQIIARRTTDSTFVSIDSKALELSIEGDYSVQEIPQAIAQLMSVYMAEDTLVTPSLTSRSMNLKAKVNTLKPLDIIMAENLVQAKNILADVDIDYVNSEINGTVSMDSLFYADIFSERVDIKAQTTDNVLDLNMAGNNNVYKGIELAILTADNTLFQGQLKSTFTAKENDELPKIKFSTLLQLDQDTMEITLEDSLVLNSKDWIVQDNNSIRFYDGKLVVDNFELTDNNEYLRVQSESAEGNNLNIDFKNFNISQFTTLLTGEPSDLTGNIDGTVEIKDMQSDIYYIINLKVDDIVYDSTSVGILSINADADPITNTIYSELSLIGPSNDVVGNGTYNTESTEADFKLDLNSFEMRLLDPFLSDIISDSEGLISGKAALSGNIQKPTVEGSLTLDKVITTMVANKSRYGIDEHTIMFDNNSIDIGILDIFDEQDNYATLTGNIYHNQLDNIIVDIVVETSKFMFLNTTDSDNPVFHGHLILDAVGTIYGPPDLLDVDVVARTLENSAITISPFSVDQFLIEEDFITYGKPEEYLDLTNEYLLKLAQQYPFNVNLLLDATDDAELTFVVDPISGDKIVGKGAGNLRIKLNPVGEQEIFGIYTVSEGSYDFSYGNFVSKEFLIEQGGTVKFSGNPLDAVLDIEAVYSAYTTTYELVKDILPENENQGQANAAKRRTNVNVYLSIAGTLDQPEISLDIKVPDLQSSSLVNEIDRKLNDLRSDPNEMNSQVFGLLLFNSFVLSTSNSSGIGSIGGNIALSSISNLISNQLNNLAGKVIQGVDVNINVNSYDSDYVNDGAGGNVTEIGLQVSKQLFNDRLSISATGNVNLAEGNEAGAYSGFLGDFVVEYKLTENGKYRVRVFSKSDYDRLLNENTNRNGISLFFKKSFDSKLKN